MAGARIHGEDLLDGIAVSRTKVQRTHFASVIDASVITLTDTSGERVSISFPLETSTHLPIYRSHQHNASSHFYY